MRILSKVWSVVVALLPCCVSAQNTAQPIPSGFDFPADEGVLLGLRDNDDIEGMRVHAWNVFAGMTQPAQDGEAIWETWFRASETFDQGPIPAGPRLKRREFSPPRQMKDPDDPQIAAPGSSLLSFVLFNKEAHDWIREKEFYKSSVLTVINNGWTAETPPEDRKIEDFPAKAMSIKTVWWTVKGQGLTAMPVWDFEPTKPDNGPEGNNDWPNWKRIVAVDPTRNQIPEGETAMLRFPDDDSDAREAKVVSLNDLYHFDVTAQNVNQILASDMPANLRPAVGDSVALVGLHYTTKEIPDWVWATFWWHDRPESGAFAFDRTANVPGVWRNYLMDVAYSTDTPREFNGAPNSCYNPWLEARFTNGMQSNCMTCHQRAVWPSVSFRPVTMGGLPADAPLFRTRTKLDFFWSIAFESE